MSAVVLLPGMMCDARLWSHQTDALRADGHEVLVGDLTGGSSVETLAGRVLDASPPRFALAGLSMGGIVAFEIWRRARARVTHLALLDTNPHPESSQRRLARTEELSKVDAGGLRDHVVTAMKPRYFAARQRSDTHLRDRVVAMALDLGPDVFRSQSLAVRDRPDSKPTLASIDVPALVLCGREDDLCPLAYHLLMAESMADADLVVLSDCGHLPPLERPEAVTDALRAWLRR